MGSGIKLKGYVVEMELPDIALQVLTEVADLCDIHSEWLTETNTNIENCFNMLQKHAIQSHDLLWQYWKVWFPNELEIRGQRNPTQEDVEMFVKQCAERFMLVVRSGFIFSLSIVEYVLKLAIRQATDGPIVNWYIRKTREAEKSGRVFRMYLRGIIEESKRVNMISTAQLNSWTGMIDLRNAIMHNNAFADEDKILKIGSIEIQTKVEKMISYPLSDRPRMMKVIVELTRNWLEKFLKANPISI